MAGSFLGTPGWLLDLDGFLAWAVKGTSLLQGNAADYWLGLLIALAFPVGRLIMDRTVYDRLARAVLKVPAYKKSDDAPTDDQLDRLRKFKESAYKCGCQVLFTVVLLLVAVPKKWFANTLFFWSDCTMLPCEAAPSLGERFVYCLEGGFYLQGIPMVFLWETKRKDRWELFAHHVATVVLIAYSYYLRLTRVGVMVLVCHEANDIFLELAKMARYAQAPEPVTTSVFVVFMLSWFGTRIYAFGFHVLRSTLFESYKHAASLGAHIEPHCSILNGFLLFLFALHVYWSYLIVRIAVRQLIHGDAEDIREIDHPEAKGPQAAAPQAGAPKGGVHEQVRRPVGPRALNPASVGSVGEMPSQM